MPAVFPRKQTASVMVEDSKEPTQQPPPLQPQPPIKEGLNRADSSVVIPQHALHTLGSSVCRALVDKDYATKKKAAQGIEDIIRFFQDKEIGVAKVRTDGIISLLVDEFLNRQDSRDAQIGGAVALVGAARGLQGNLKYYLDAIVKPILIVCETSQDVAVKYYTAEVRLIE